MRAILATAFLALALPAYAHKAPSGWQYPHECCSDRDCAPLPEAQTPKPLPHGDWLLTTGEVVPRAKVKGAPDGFYHLCRSEVSNTVLCLFVPPQGS